MFLNLTHTTGYSFKINTEKILWITRNQDVTTVITQNKSITVVETVPSILSSITDGSMHSINPVKINDQPSRSHQILINTERVLQAHFRDGLTDVTYQTKDNTTFSVDESLDSYVARFNLLAYRTNVLDYFLLDEYDIQDGSDTPFALNTKYIRQEVNGFTFIYQKGAAFNRRIKKISPPFIVIQEPDPPVPSQELYNTPSGMVSVVDDSGDVFLFVMDAGNKAMRRVTVPTNIVSNALFPLTDGNNGAEITYSNASGTPFIYYSIRTPDIQNFISVFETQLLENIDGVEFSQPNLILFPTVSTAGYGALSAITAHPRKVINGRPVLYLPVIPQSPGIDVWEYNGAVWTFTRMRPDDFNGGGANGYRADCVVVDDNDVVYILYSDIFLPRQKTCLIVRGTPITPDPDITDETQYTWEVIAGQEGNTNVSNVEGSGAFVGLSTDISRIKIWDHDINGEPRILIFDTNNDTVKLLTKTSSGNIDPRNDYSIVNINDGDIGRCYDGEIINNKLYVTSAFSQVIYELDLAQPFPIAPVVFSGSLNVQGFQNTF